MTNGIENDLGDALRRKPAPEGFADRVMERVATGASTMPARPFLRRRHWWLAAAAAIAVVIGAGVLEHQRRIRSRNEEALQRTLTAFSILNNQLDRAENITFRSSRWERLSRQLKELPASDAR